ncbi:MAG TPA: hypothetical protein VME86_03430 [Acidobacteriaceae bacterium]|nr:hypothetical protein [Acidobacteriaceae bacterium]
MPATPARLESSQPPSVEQPSGARGILGWSSFAFAFLQSICTAIIAINGVRLGIGIGALVITSGVGADMVRFHADWLRIPMLSLALVGSLVNIAILIHARRLRNRPAAQWRRKPLTKHQLRMEQLQWVLSVAALVLIAIEESLHVHLNHRF